jgi:predicted  nucleic acid-binding Zn-ribbon protein
MEPQDLTVEILKSIRDEAKATNSRLDQTNSRLDRIRNDLSDQIVELRQELSRRIVQSEVRTATAITELAGSVREMTGVLRSSAELRPRVERCEQEIAEIRATLASR